ncbi:MAG TPA: S8 family serine peptidase [Blastocatellia bacterium]|nr:S8 family serine peptidase [Blastocatellia bacterium]
MRSTLRRFVCGACVGVIGLLAILPQEGIPGTHQGPPGQAGVLKSLNESAEQAEQALKEAAEAIEEAQEAINEALAVGADVSAASARLNQAQSKLTEARAAFLLREYAAAERLAQEAEELAEEAAVLAEEAISDTSRSRQEAEEAIADAQHAIEEVQAKITRFQSEGINVQAAQATLNEAIAVLSRAKAAFAAGDFTAARNLAHRAEDLADDAEDLLEEAVETTPRRRSHDEEVIIEIAGPVPIASIASRYQLQVLDRIENTNFYRVKIPAGTTVDKVLAQLRSDPDIADSEPNFILQMPEVEQKGAAFVDQKGAAFVDGSSPPNYFDQSALDRINLKQAQRAARGEGVTVAVIDTGIDLRHPAFQGRLSQTLYDFVDNDPDPSETGRGLGFGHGTFVAGLIALVAPRAKIMALRAFNASGEGTTFDIAKAIVFATNNGARVINMSFGMDTRSIVLDRALSYAEFFGVTGVAAAGNEGLQLSQYPANDPDVVAVAATDASDVKASFSNYGGHIDVSAPGVGLYSAYPGGKFAWWSGTSFATALVSGEAALILSALPPAVQRSTSARRRVIPIIKAATAPIDSINPPKYWGKLGSGRIDVLQAVQKTAKN